MPPSKVSMSDCSIATEKLMRFYSLESKIASPSKTKNHFTASKNPPTRTPTKAEPIAKEKLLRFYGGLPPSVGSPSSLVKDTRRPVRASSDGSVNPKAKEKLMRFYGLQPMAQKTNDQAEERDELPIGGSGIRMESPGKPGSFKRKILRASSSKF